MVGACRESEKTSRGVGRRLCRERNVSKFWRGWPSVPGVEEELR